MGQHVPTSRLLDTPCGVEASASAPVWFKREVGALREAHAQFGQLPRQLAPTSAAAKKGLRFEAKVHGFLQQTYADRFIRSLPFGFSPYAGKPGRAIPDGLLFSGDWRSVCVVEIKLRHTADAWHQLNQFYLPIVRRAWAGIRVSGLEVCAYYDPGQKLPQEVAFVNSAEAALETRECFHPLMILTEREIRRWMGG